MSGRGEPPCAASGWPTVSAEQAIAFRLGRQHLLSRVGGASLERVLGEINGAQAQLLPAARLALWSRVRELDPAEIDRRLWRRRSLLRAWCMRRTLHLLPARDGAIYGRGSARRSEKEIRWMLHHGATRPRLEADIGTLLDLLDRPRTRTGLAEALGRRLGTRPTDRIGGAGWGNAQRIPWLRFGGVPVPIAYAIHLAGARGVICLGAAERGEADSVRADAWSRSWREMPQADAERELLLRYLRSFGPATQHDFATWTGMTLGDAKEVWRTAGDRVVPVACAGAPAWILRRDRDELTTATLGDRPSVRLLPHFDAYLLGHRDHANVVAREHRHRVYRPQGWVSPVVLLDGRVAGVWEANPKGRVLRVRVEPFVRLPRAAEPLLRNESLALGTFLGYRESVLRIERTGGPRPRRASSGVGLAPSEPG